MYLNTLNQTVGEKFTTLFTAISDSHENVDDFYGISLTNKAQIV